MTRNTDDHAPDDRPAGPPRRRSRNRPTGSARPTGLRLSQTLASPRFVACDDVLATGGTAAATCRLVEELGGVVVGLGFLIEIGGLGGRGRLGGRVVEGLHRY